MGDFFLILIPVFITCFLKGVTSVQWVENCVLPKENCNVENQVNLGAYFESAYVYIGSKYEKVLMLDAKTANGTAARLVTPFIDVNKTPASRSICIKLEYMMDGDGISQITVVQHGSSGGRKIYDVGEDKKGKWILTLMDSEHAPDGVYRYFIETRLQTGKDGVVLIRNFSYVTGKCKPGVGLKRKRKAKLRNLFFDFN